MDERNVHLPRDIRQRGRAIAIDAEGPRRFSFGLIYRRIGGRVDDRRRPDRRNELVDTFPIL